MVPIPLLWMTPHQDIPWACFEMERPLLAESSVVLTASRSVECPHSNPSQVCVRAQSFYRMVGWKISGAAFCSTSGGGELVK